MIKVVLAISIYFSYFALMNWRGVAQPGRVPALGAGCRWFDSSHPDHFKKLDCQFQTLYSPGKFNESQNISTFKNRYAVWIGQHTGLDP